MSENIVKCSEFVYTREYRYIKLIYYYYYVMKDSPYEEPRKTTQGQRPVSPTGTLTRHANKYKMHELHQRHRLDVPFSGVFIPCV